MRFNFYIIFTIVFVVLFEPIHTSYDTWQTGLENCLDTDNKRPVTAEDVAQLQNSSWMYAAQFKIKTGGTIIIQMRKTEENITCYGMCNKTCQVCDTDLVFNDKDRSSLRRQQKVMIPGIHYIMKDSHFDDNPDPDECFEYEFAERKLVARNCSDVRDVECINGSKEAYITTACYQGEESSICLPNIESSAPTDSHGPKECQFPAFCPKGYLCQGILIGGVFLISIIFSIVCVQCCINYQVRRILKKIRHTEPTADQKDFKMKIFTYNYTDKYLHPTHSSRN